MAIDKLLLLNNLVYLIFDLASKDWVEEPFTVSLRNAFSVFKVRTGRQEG